MGVPPDGSFIREDSSNIDELGVPKFMDTSTITHYFWRCTPHDGEAAEIYTNALGAVEFLASSVKNCLYLQGGAPVRLLSWFITPITMVYR